MIVLLERYGMKFVHTVILDVWLLDMFCIWYRGFIRSWLLAVNRRLCCFSLPVTKPHIQEGSSCNIKYRNGQKQL